jgi:hypothetical protein
MGLGRLWKRDPDVQREQDKNLFIKQRAQPTYDFAEQATKQEGSHTWKSAIDRDDDLLYDSAQFIHAASADDKLELEGRTFARMNNFVRNPELLLKYDDATLDKVLAVPPGLSNDAEFTARHKAVFDVLKEKRQELLAAKNDSNNAVQTSTAASAPQQQQTTQPAATKPVANNPQEIKVETDQKLAQTQVQNEQIAAQKKTAQEESSKKMARDEVLIVAAMHGVTPTLTGDLKGDLQQVEQKAAKENAQEKGSIAQKASDPNALPASAVVAKEREKHGVKPEEDEKKLKEKEEKKAAEAEKQKTEEKKNNDTPKPAPPK